MIRTNSCFVLCSSKRVVIHVFQPLCHLKSCLNEVQDANMQVHFEILSV